MGHQIIGLYSINSTTEKDLIKINNHYNINKEHLIKNRKKTVQ